MLQNRLRRRELRYSARTSPRRGLKHPRRAAVTVGARTMSPEPVAPVAGSRPRAAPPERSHAWTRYLRAFWDRAYRENVTGLAGMVAYNLLFALFPFALLILFV